MGQKDAQTGKFVLQRRMHKLEVYGTRMHNLTDYGTEGCTNWKYPIKIQIF